MAEMPVRLFSMLTEDSGSAVGAILAHVMDASTADIPPPPPLPRLLLTPISIPFPLPSLPLHPILYLRTPS